MEKCEECGTEVDSGSLRSVIFEGPDSVVIVEQDLCDTCYDRADDFVTLNDVEVINVVKEV